MNSCSLEHALDQIIDLKKNGLPKIFEVSNGHRRAYTFESNNRCLIVQDNMGNVMGIEEMEELVSFLEYSIENLNEKYIIDKKIEILEEEIEGYREPKIKDFKPKTNKKGHVYLIKGESGRYKIGCSNNPSRRCKELRLSSSENHTLIHSFKCLDMYKTEKELHALFDSKRVHSEWFELNKKDVSLVKAITNEI